MNSKRVEEYIEKYAVGNSRDGAASMLKRRVIECVELAELDAESRVIAEAIKAHRDCCPLNEFQCLHRDRDDYTCTYACKYVTSFIQKLNKE